MGNPSGGSLSGLPRGIAPALLAAGGSVLCLRSGFFSFFFLLPLGLAAFGGGAKTAWGAGICAAALNVIAALWLCVYRGADPLLLRWPVLYNTLMIAAFTWINAPLGKWWILAESPWRIAAAAAAAALILAPVLLAAVHDSRLEGFFLGQFKTVENMSGGLPGGMTEKEFLEAALHAGLRGGILLSCAVFWWINRQLASGIVRLFRRFEGAPVSGVPSGVLPGFHVPPFLVWVLSLSLGTILLGKISGLEAAEIGGWNILLLSAMMFLVQGTAVAFHYLARVPAALRLLINLGIVMLFFIPGAHAALPGLLIVLVLIGIAENWVPFRAPKINGPPSTPGA